MYEELVKRLRYDAELLSQDGWAAGLFTEAADAIEGLNKRIEFEHQSGFADGQIAANRKKLRWISVTEQLPNVDTNKSGYETVTVLVTVQGWKNAQPMTYQRACVRDKTVYRWKWVWGKIYDGPPITHWMPLPPPKEE